MKPIEVRALDHVVLRGEGRGFDVPSTGATIDGERASELATAAWRSSRAARSPTR